jgi:integrase
VPDDLLGNAIASQHSCPADASEELAVLNTSRSHPRIDDVFDPALGLHRLAPHDLRRSCARLCHNSGGELEQIQFLLGHVSVQTSERYIGCKQRLKIAVNDRIGIEPALAA